MPSLSLSSLCPVNGLCRACTAPTEQGAFGAWRRGAYPIVLIAYYFLEEPHQKPVIYKVCDDECWIWRTYDEVRGFSAEKQIDQVHKNVGPSIYAPLSSVCFLTFDSDFCVESIAKKIVERWLKKNVLTFLFTTTYEEFTTTRYPISRLRRCNWTAQIGQSYGQYGDFERCQKVKNVERFDIFAVTSDIWHLTA